MIEQRPAAIAISTLREKNLEGIVTIDTDSARASMAEQMFHFGGPLRVGRAAKAKAVSEETGPIFACAKIAFREAGAPKVFRAFFAVPVMSIAPEPRGERSLFVVGWRSAGGLAVLCGLSCEQLLKSGASQFARIPGMISLDLWITDVGA